MKEDWEKLYRSVLVERNPTLRRLRITAAQKAVMRRIKGTGDTGERRKLDRAIEMLSLLRSRV